MRQAAKLSTCCSPVKVWTLHAHAYLLGKINALQFLFGNLQVDISKALSLLVWLHPVYVEKGLRR